MDISGAAGSPIVASVVRLTEGVPDRSLYCHYKIRSTRDQDDFQAMYEVLSRRARRGVEEGDLPDLMVIDGGKGQLAAALSAFGALEIEPPVVLALAKREEEVFVMGREAALRPSRHSFALRLLQYVRDEAHRFAQHYHHILRRKSTLGE